MLNLAPGFAQDEGDGARAKQAQGRQGQKGDKTQGQDTMFPVLL